MPLRQLRKPITHDCWSTSSRFEQVRAALRSGIPRMSEFDALDDMDKWYLLAYWRAQDAMSAHEQRVAEERANAEALNKVK